MTCFDQQDLANLAAHLRDGRAANYPDLVKCERLDAQWAELDLLAITAIAEDWRAAVAGEPRNPDVPDCNERLKSETLRTSVKRYDVRIAGLPSNTTQDLREEHLQFRDAIAELHRLIPGDWCWRTPTLIMERKAA